MEDYISDFDNACKKLKKGINDSSVSYGDVKIFQGAFWSDDGFSLTLEIEGLGAESLRAAEENILEYLKENNFTKIESFPDSSFEKLLRRGKNIVDFHYHASSPDSTFSILNQRSWKKKEKVLIKIYSKSIDKAKTYVTDILNAIKEGD